MTESFLARVRARRAEIAQQRAALDTEDAELEITERHAIRLDGDPNQKILVMKQVSEDPLADKFSGKKPSIKDLIIRTLKQAPEAWVESSSWVWARIREEHGIEINKNSFYPQMHSMVNDDKTVIRDGKRLALAERLSRRELREIADREAAE